MMEEKYSYFDKSASIYHSVHWGIKSTSETPPSPLPSILPSPLCELPKLTFLGSPLYIGFFVTPIS